MTQFMEILVLDDEREAADLLSAVLSLRLPGASIRTAYTGNAAVAAGTAQRPDAAILDLEMAGLDGEGVAHALRSAYPDSRPLLIAVSGNTLRLGELRQSGIFDYLVSRPIDIAGLIEMLKGKGRSA
ncbi:response regulator [Variovorax sp. DXTD-1]|uniref:response regulator n=1 Tax=Variovorax sp. DXTD-1 TaxID=2495592 RepID=UPI000F86421C|nr:response regulator [Variovorax sp. DXTD-1]RST52069.1 response regulator [Variovorax sp. DXTD-1]